MHSNRISLLPSSNLPQGLHMQHLLITPDHPSRVSQVGMVVGGPRGCSFFRSFFRSFFLSLYVRSFFRSFALSFARAFICSFARSLVSSSAVSSFLHVCSPFARSIAVHPRIGSPRALERTKLHDNVLVCGCISICACLSLQLSILSHPVLSEHVCGL